MTPLPIAHRGFWWPELNHQNLPRAFEAASKAGYGLELDVRSLSGEKIVIKHGPGEGVCMALTADNIAPLFTAPLLAWNVKDERGGTLLLGFLAQNGLAEKSFLFDFELVEPHLVQRLMGKGVTLAGRASDRPDEALEDVLHANWLQAVWLDAFEQDWITADTIRAVHAAGKAAYVVSPELHGRPLDLALWTAWREAEGIATDFPHLLAALQGGGPLEPVDPWWGP